MLCQFLGTAGRRVESIADEIEIRPDWRMVAALRQGELNGTLIIVTATQDQSSTCYPLPVAQYDLLASCRQRIMCHYGGLVNEANVESGLRSFDRISPQKSASVPDP